MQALRENYSPLRHFALDRATKTLCKHHKAVKLRPCTDFTGPVCSDCLTAIDVLQRKERDERRAN